MVGSKVVLFTCKKQPQVLGLRYCDQDILLEPTFEHESARGTTFEIIDRGPSCLSIVPAAATAAATAELSLSMRENDVKLYFSKPTAKYCVDWEVLRSKSDFQGTSTRVVLRNASWGAELQLQVVQPANLAKVLVSEWASLVIDQMKMRHKIQRELDDIHAEAVAALECAVGELQAIRIDTGRRAAASEPNVMAVATPYKKEPKYLQISPNRRSPASLTISEVNNLSPVAMRQDVSPSTIRGLLPLLIPHSTPSTSNSKRQSRDSTPIANEECKTDESVLIERADNFRREQLTGKMFESWAVAYSSTPIAAEQRQEGLPVESISNYLNLASVVEKHEAIQNRANGHETTDDRRATTNESDAQKEESNAAVMASPRTGLGEVVDGLLGAIRGDDARKVSVSSLLCEMERQNHDRDGVLGQIELLRREVKDEKAVKASLDMLSASKFSVLQNALRGENERTNLLSLQLEASGKLQDLRLLRVEELLEALGQHSLDKAPILTALEEILMPPSQNRDVRAPIHEARGGDSTGPDASAQKSPRIILPKTFERMRLAQFHRLCESYDVDDYKLFQAEEKVASSENSDLVNAVQSMILDSKTKTLLSPQSKHSLNHNGGDRLSILAIRRMCMPEFVRTLELCGHEEAIAEVYSLALALDARISIGKSQSDDDEEEELSTPSPTAETRAQSRCSDVTSSVSSESDVSIGKSQGDTTTLRR